MSRSIPSVILVGETGHFYLLAGVARRSYGGEGQHPETLIAATRAGGGFPSPRVVAQTVELDVRVLLVDDHRLVRHVLARAISAEPDIEVVGEGSNGQEALDLTRQLAPDVILIGVRLPVLNGVDATRAILAEFPSIHVIGMTLVDNRAEAQAIREVGATSCVSKTGPMEELIRAIRDCHPIRAPKSQDAKG